MVSQELLEELQIILKDDCNQDLPIEEVSKIGNDLVGLFDLLAKNYHEYSDELKPEYSDVSHALSNNFNKQ